MARTIHWIALAGIFAMLALDHLPERTSALLMAAWSDTPAVTSEWDSLPVMYD